MAWEPGLKISGGFYGGYSLPDGNLDDLISICPVHDTDNHTVRYSGSHNNGDPQATYLDWLSPFGIPWDKLKSQYINWLDPTDPARTIVLIEIPVKNAEHAQYYKQSLTIYISISSTARTEIGPGDFNLLNYTYYEFNILKFCRREYPTPYSAWTETQLTSLSTSSNGNVVYTGNESLGGFWLDLTDDMLFFSGTFDNGANWGFGAYWKWHRADNLVQGNAEVVYGVDLDYLKSVFGGDFEPEEEDDPNDDPGGDSDEGGGDGDHDNTEDDIPIPDLPPVGAADAGFVHMFSMTLTNMVSFAQDMFNPDIWAAIKAFFADPMDFIAGIMIMPFAPPSSRSRIPKFGNNTWSHAYPLVDSQFYELDCGSLYVQKYYDSFLDFDSYTKVKIYLPYIGYKDLIADEVMGKTIRCVYHIDVATGDCVCFLEITGDGYKQVCYQFQGNCGVRVPYGRQSFDAAVSASLALLGGIGTVAVGGAIVGAGMATEAAAGIAAAQIAGQVGSMTASSVSGMKRNMERSGALGGSAGYMGVQKPYLIRQIPNQSKPSNYRELHGYPSNIGGKLADFSGLTTIESIKLTGVICTENEKEEIMTMARGGVII